MDRAYRLGFGALTLLFPFVWFLSRDLASNVVYALSLVFFAGIAWRHTGIRADRMLLLCLGFCGFIVLGYVWHVNSVPEELFGGSRARTYLASVCFFLVLAHGLASMREPSPFALLASAALGLLVYLAVQAPPDHWARGWEGRRVDFGIDNAQHAGVLFGTGLLAAVAFIPRGINALPARMRHLGGILVTALTLFMAWGVLVTQVRAVWIALIVAAPVLLALSLWLTRSRRSTHPLPHRSLIVRSAAVVLTLLTLAFLVADGPTRISERLAREDVSLAALASAARLETDGRLSSTQVRVASWAVATEWIAERPLMGWGARTVNRLIEHSPHFSDDFKLQFGHIHSSYFEVLIAIGTLGFAGIAAIAALVGYRTIIAWRNGWMPTDAFVFAWAFFVFWLVVNAFESYITYPSGFFLNSVVGGFVYAFYLRGERWQLRTGELACPGNRPQST